jgi:hypothetical protein
MTARTKLDGIKLANSLGKIGGNENATAVGHTIRKVNHKVNQQHAQGRTYSIGLSFARPLNITDTLDPRPLIRSETSGNDTAKIPCKVWERQASHLSGRK